jgi:hypothetical protein
MAKKSFAPPVTNFSISCDPSLVTWLNNYAHEKRTSRSKVVRKALVDFRAEHEADARVAFTHLDPVDRCVECSALVLQVPGARALCTASPHHIQEPPAIVENPIEDASNYPGLAKLGD